MKRIVRENIKLEAKSKPKKHLALSLLILIIITIILMTISFLICKLVGYTYDIKVVNDLILGIILIILSPFILNFYKVSVDISNNKQMTYKDMFLKIKDTKFIKLSFMLIFSLLVILWIMNLIPVIGLFVNMVILILFFPLFVLIPFVYLENDSSNKEIISKTMDIVSGNRIKFYGMIISFILWIIISCLTCGILFFYVIPYMFISIYLLYQSLTHEKEFKKTENISDGNIILIFIGVIIFIIMFLAVNFPNSRVLFQSIITGEIHNVGGETLTYGGAEVTFDVPNGYKISASANTSKTYINDNNYNVLQYSIYLASVEDAMKMDKEIVNEMRESNEYKKIEEEEFTLKINNKEIKGYMYTTLKNDEKTSSVMIYYPKGDFTISVSLYNDGKILSKEDIKEFITIY